jgi:membrane-associated phospholipid phosphatase
MSVSTTGPHLARTGVPRTRCVTVALALAAPFSVLLLMVAGRWGPLISLDAWIAETLHRQAVKHSGWTRLNQVLTDWVWDPTTMRALLALAVVVALWRRMVRVAVWLMVCGVAGGLLQQGVKLAVGRPRPQWPDPVDSAHYNAFPSGHAMTAAIVCEALLWLYLRSSGAGPLGRTVAWTLAVVAVVGVGFTRVFLGVHWASDVVGGFLLAGVVVAGSAAVCAPYRAGWRT